MTVNGKNIKRLPINLSVFIKQRFVFIKVDVQKCNARRKNRGGLKKKTAMTG